MTEAFVIDGDDGYIPLEVDPVKVRIGGTIYAVNCPPDKKWHLFTPLQDGTEGGVDSVMEFMRCSLAEEDTVEILARMRDEADTEVTLLKLMYVFSRVLEHFQPQVQEHFATLGIEGPGDPEEANREQRRAAAKKARTSSATAGKRTPRSKTGARTGR